MAREPKRKITEPNSAGLIPPPDLGGPLIGHEAAEAAMHAAFASGRMHHAWMISGPKGIGKATLAFRMARHILSDGKNSENIGKQIASGAAQDLLVLRRPIDEKTGIEKSVIPVDEVRRLQGFFSLSAGAGGWRVAIIDSVDDLNMNSANALLKSLEEPPEKTVLLLVAHSPGRALPTIRSRCRKLSLGAMPREVLADRLPALGAQYGLPTMPANDMAVLASLANGRVGRALYLWSMGGLVLFEALQAALENWPNLQPERIAALQSAANTAKADGGFALMADLIITVLQRAARSQALGVVDDSASANLAAQAPGHLWAELATELDSFFAKGANINLDDKMMLSEAMRRISSVAKAA